MLDSDWRRRGRFRGRALVWDRKDVKTSGNSPVYIVFLMFCTPRFLRWTSRNCSNSTLGKPPGNYRMIIGKDPANLLRVFEYEVAYQAQSLEGSNLEAVWKLSGSCLETAALCLIFIIIYIHMARCDIFLAASKRRKRTPKTDKIITHATAGRGPAGVLHIANT